MYMNAHITSGTCKKSIKKPIKTSDSHNSKENFELIKLCLSVYMLKFHGTLNEKGK